MNVVILRLNVGDFGKIGSYNVQEVGLGKSLMSYGCTVNVLYTHKDVKMVTKDETYDFVYYLPHKSFGLHGIIDVNLLSIFNPDAFILFSDNQLWAKNVILWCNKQNIPCIHYFGGVLSNNKKILNQLYTKLILFRNRRSYEFSINIAKTKSVKSELEKHHIKCNGVINVGLDDSVLEDKRNLDVDIRKELGLSDNDLIILFVGRLAEDKRPLAALDILKEMLKRTPNVKLIMIGHGVMKSRIDNKILELGISDKVIQINNVPYDEMYKYMVASDCCINLSHVEIFGMTILESMYYGLPVIAHSAPGPNEIITNEESGFLLSTDDCSAWCDKILTAINKRESISNKAHERIKNSFIWRVIAKQYLDLLK